MPETTNKQNRRGRLGRTAAPARYLRRISVVAATGIAAILAVGLFAASPYTRQAQAIDANLGGTNASLVFNPTFMGLNQIGYLCAFNLNQTKTVTVELVFDSVTFGDHQAQTVQLAPRSEACAGRDGVSNLSDFIIGSVVLKAPVECSQATDYPGKCKVTGSLEVADYDPSTDVSFPGKTNRIHLDPVLLLGSPGNQRVTTIPQ